MRLLQQSVQAGGTGKELPTLALVRALEASPVWGFPCNGLHRDKANSSCTLMMHWNKFYQLNRASWYPHCTLNNSNSRQIFPVHLVTQRLSSGDAAWEQHCVPTAHEADDGSEWVPGPGHECAKLGPILSWHGLLFPTWDLAAHHPDCSNGHSSEWHQLPDTILQWRGWLGGCFPLCSAIRNWYWTCSFLSKLLTQAEFSLCVLFDAYLVIKKGRSWICSTCCSHLTKS